METLKTQLTPQATNPHFVQKFSDIKKANKMRLQKWVKDNTGVEIPLDALYDI